MTFNRLLSYLLSSLLAGLATFALAETVTEESGPFHIFDRLRYWLIPEALRPITLDVIYDDIDPSNENDVSVYEIAIIDLEKEFDFVETLLAVDEVFNNSLRGTIFNILTCKFCFGVWAAHFIKPLLFLVFFGFTGVNFGLGVLLSFVAVAFQRIIIEWFNKR